MSVAAKDPRPYGFANELCDAGDCPVERVNWYEAALLANLLSIAEGLEPCYVLLGCGGEGIANMGAGCGMDDLCDEGTYACDDASFVGLDCEGYRLPTDAEREFAARAFDWRSTYAGDILDSPCDDPEFGAADQISWYFCNSGDRSQPVAGLQPNDFGLFDMLGNIIEWTTDLGEDGQPAPGGIDPIGAAGDQRITRSGSFHFFAEFGRAAMRIAAEPEIRSLFLGLRLVRTVPVEDGVTCPPPNIFGNFSVTVSDDYNFGSIATYTCLPGFSTEEFNQRVCSANGNWSGFEPTCTEM